MPKAGKVANLSLVREEYEKSRLSSSLTHCFKVENFQNDIADNLNLFKMLTFAMHFHAASTAS